MSARGTIRTDPGSLTNACYQGVSGLLQPFSWSHLSSTARTYRYDLASERPPEDCQAGFCRYPERIHVFIRLIATGGQ
jgi:hypothetical protein